MGLVSQHPAMFVTFLLAVGAYVFGPLLWRMPRGWGETEAAYAPLELQQLEQQRDAALHALHDLEEERALGKLSQADYDELRGHYMRLAADWLGRIERYREESGR